MYWSINIFIPQDIHTYVFHIYISYICMDNNTYVWMYFIHTWASIEYICMNNIHTYVLSFIQDIHTYVLLFIHMYFIHTFAYINPMIHMDLFINTFIQPTYTLVHQVFFNKNLNPWVALWQASISPSSLCQLKPKPLSSLEPVRIMADIYVRHAHTAVVRVQ